LLDKKNPEDEKEEKQTKIQMRANIQPRGQHLGKRKGLSREEKKKRESRPAPIAESCARRAHRANSSTYAYS
jgi:hypothetical protein